MNNIRDKFEAWAKAHEIDITINPAPSYDARLYNDDETDAMYCGWQAATEQSQKEIAGLEAKLNELVKFQSSADRLAKAQAESLNTIAELKAREKELVEALESIIESGLLNGSYKLHTKIDKIAREALATVRGE